MTPTREKSLEAGRLRTAKWRARRVEKLHAARILHDTYCTELARLLDEIGLLSAVDHAVVEHTVTHTPDQSAISSVLGVQPVIQLDRGTPRLAWSEELQTGLVVDAAGRILGHSGQLAMHPAAGATRAGEGPKQPTQRTLSCLEAPVIDWSDAPLDKVVLQEVRSVDNGHMLTAMHVPWVCAGALTKRSESELQGVFRNIMLGTRSFARSSYAAVTGDTVGRHIELGWGSMPGRSRHSTQSFSSGDVSSLLPFWKRENASVAPEMHESLSEASALIAEIMHRLDPQLLALYNRGLEPWPELARALTYPLPKPGRHHLHGHQCACRLRGVWLDASEAENAAAKTIAADLHRDTQATPQFTHRPTHTPASTSGRAYLCTTHPALHGCLVDTGFEAPCPGGTAGVHAPPPSPRDAGVTASQWPQDGRG